jgi:hypothetical protein
MDKKGRAMSPDRIRPAANVITILLVLAASPNRAGAEGGLTTIDNPGGGKIIYGPLNGVSSMRDAMVLVLRAVHNRFGERPQVGRFFQAGDSHSMATFFRLNERPAGGAVRPVSGLAIVSMPEGSQPAAAVLVDDAARFGKTGPVMMKRLGQAWRADAARAAGPAPSGSAAPPPSEPGAGAGERLELHPATAGDRSASIGLPEGWRLTGVAHGQLGAEGPNGETVNRGVILHGIEDHGSPQGGRMRGPPPLVCPRGGDLFEAFVSVSNQVRESQRMTPATYKLVSSGEVHHSPFEVRAIQAAFEVDFHDNRGPRKGTARIGAIYPQGFPTWKMTIDTSTVPKTVAAREEATMLAIDRSYSQNSKVITRQAQASVDHTHQVGEETQKKFEAHMKQIDANGAKFDAHMDNMDRYSKSFQNYIFDRSQVQDSDRRERATVDDGDADALVKADPERFQIVPTQDFIKGVDY